MIYVVSPHGHEPYSERRLKGAIMRAVLTQDEPIGTAENFAEVVARKIENWLHNKTEITATELRRQVATALATYDADAAYFYERQHMVL